MTETFELFLSVLILLCASHVFDGSRGLYVEFQLVCVVEGTDTDFTVHPYVTKQVQL